RPACRRRCSPRRSTRASNRAGRRSLPIRYSRRCVSPSAVTPRSPAEGTATMERRDCDAIVLFGATGDLCYRKIYPALYQLLRRGLLAVPVVGVARQGCDVKWLVNRVRDSLKAFIPGADETVAGRLTELLRYVDGDYNDRATFDKLRRTLGEAQRPLQYLAVPPRLFPEVIEHQRGSGCAGGAHAVVETHFQPDLHTA